jgi:5'-nucleotidase
MKKTLPDPVIVPENSKIRLYPSGAWFDPINPTQEDMDSLTVEIIAHALSQLCRFGGQCKHFYSVAQHAYYVSKWCSPWNLEGLHHDDTEGCGLNDIIRPVKYAPGFEAYREYEANLSNLIDKKFNLHPMTEAVKRADDQMLVAEMKALAPGSYLAYLLRLKQKGYMEIHVDIEYWDCKKAEQMYLNRHYELMAVRKDKEQLQMEGYLGVDKC